MLKQNSNKVIKSCGQKSVAHPYILILPSKPASTRLIIGRIAGEVLSKLRLKASRVD